MELAEIFFLRSPYYSQWKERYTLFLGETPPFPPPKKNCLSSKANIGLFVQNFNNGSTSQLRSILNIIFFGVMIKIFIFITCDILNVTYIEV
jgi:hypothetical protein